MTTLRQLSIGLESVPTAVSWYLADLGEARGKQELVTKRSPQRLKALREHALVESAVSSNRIEGVEVEGSRVGTVVFGKSLPRNRDEEEVRGYREALAWIHDKGASIPINEKTILKLHRMCRGDIWDAGKYKEKDGDIIERRPEGGIRVRFKPTPAKKTPAAVKTLVDDWRDAIRNKHVHPLIALTAFNLDFLCIHPFRDGNGRVSRLLLLLQCYHLGYEAGRYVSIERLIEKNKERYYETLEQSSQGWHEGKHDPWPYIGFVLFILKNAYAALNEQTNQAPTPRGEKRELVLRAMSGAKDAFRVADIQKQCPGVSVDMIRKVLKELRAEGRVQCLGRGQAAQWKRSGRWPKDRT